MGTPHFVDSSVSSEKDFEVDSELWPWMLPRAGCGASHVPQMRHPTSAGVIYLQLLPNPQWDSWSLTN